MCEVSNYKIGGTKLNKRYMTPRFKAALAAYEDVIPAGTYWRYRNGILPPPLGPLLVEHPELAEALAKDARDLAAMKKKKGSDQ